MKAGYKTSEFWFTLVSFIFSGLFLIGVIREDQTKEELISVVSHGVESVILIGGQLILLYRYINSREKYRKQYLIDEENKHNQIEQTLENHVGVDKSYSKININEADLGELIQLPHIGPSTGQKIIEHRTKYGKFQNPQDITSVVGIKDTTFNEIKDYITIG
jgi:competence ComEA-like helix-hairpin-helix protein